VTLIRSFYRRRRLTTVLLCLFALNAALAFSATAADDAPDKSGDEKQEERGKVYVEYAVGLSFPPNQTIKGADATGDGLWGDTKIDPGYYVGAALGSNLLDFFRAEVRIDFRGSEVSRMSVQGEASSTDGDVRLFSVMANGYFDLDLDSKVTPWVGAGIGWGRVELDAQNKDGADQLDVSDTDSVFVYNFMAGATYEISKITDVSLGYRYVATEDITFQSSIGDSRTQKMDYEYDSHEIFLGLRFNF
jgi:opacity protein-like surface antigen